MRRRSDLLPVISEPPRELCPFFRRRDRDFLYRRKGGLTSFRDDMHVEVWNRLEGRHAVVLLDQDAVWVER